MEIVFVVSALHGGGAERVVSLLANGFAKRGDDVTILMIAGRECEYKIEKNVRLLSIGKASKGNLLTQLKRLINLRDFIKERPNARIIAFSTTINMFSIISCIGLKNHLSVSERNDPERFNHKRIRDLIYRAGAFNGVSFLFQTPDAKDYFSFSKAIIKNSKIVPNPVVIKEFHTEELKIKDDAKESEKKESDEKESGKTESYRTKLPAEKKIVAAGRLEPQKNYPLLLRAFAEFKKKNPDYELVIYGKGKLLEALKDKAAELKIDNSVRFMGFSPNWLEESLNARMFVLSSDYEGMPNVLMEAMAAGIACISTDCPCGGPGMLIKNEESGLLVPVGDEAALGSAMDKIAKSDELRKKLSENAMAVKEEYSLEKIMDLIV